MSTWNPIIPAPIYAAMPALSNAALRTALVLAKHANAAGQAWPGLNTIAAESGMTRRGAQKGIRALESAGLIDIEAGGGAENTNRYHLKTANHGSPPTANHGSPLKAKKGERSDTKTVNHGSPELSKELSKKLQARESDIDALLDAFAAKVKPGGAGAQARDRSGSRKQFKQTAARLLKTHPLEDLIRACENYAAAEVETEPRFRKGFQSFFGPKLELFADYLPGNCEIDAPGEGPELSEAQIAEIIALENEIAQGGRTDA